MRLSQLILFCLIAIRTAYARSVPKSGSAEFASLIPRGSTSQDTQTSKTSFDVANPIHSGLTSEYKSIYKTSIGVAKKPGYKPPQVVVVSDAGRDTDDTKAIVILSELHQLGIIQLHAFIANLKPSHDRARFLRGTLDSLGLHSIPVGTGTDGTDKTIDLYPYEFKVPWMAPESTKFEDGQALLRKTFADAKPKKQKISLVLISSLRDIAKFVEADPAAHSLIEDVNIQGGYALKTDLPPDDKAANNGFDLKAAATFDKFLWENQIPSTAWAKGAGMVSSPSRLWVENLKETKHELAVPIYQQWYQGLEQLYLTTLKKGKDTVGLKGMSPEAFIKRFAPGWYEGEKGKQGKQPKDFSELAQYITTVSTQDPFAAIGAGGPAFLTALKIFPSPAARQKIRNHELVGEEGHEGGFDAKRLKEAVEAFLMGGLLRPSPGSGKGTGASASGDASGKASEKGSQKESGSEQTPMKAGSN